LIFASSGNRRGGKGHFSSAPTIEQLLIRFAIMDVVFQRILVDDKDITVKLFKDA
jgi:hypothetical protein